jgi:metallophosphoesterase (TIGR00282 family)
VKVLFLGDIVGKAGRRAVELFLRRVQEEHDVSFTIANGENAAGGFGVTLPVVEDLFAAGIDVITTGNHVWDKREALQLLPKEHRLLRPLNYPPGTPGVGSVVMKDRLGHRIGVLNIEGRVFMRPQDCPFRAAEDEIRRMKEETPVIIVDFHAEATSEKLAMGWHLDGKASAVFGTHTHVQTADEQILPEGTAYITDVGMTGPSESVIGVKKEIILRRFLTSMPERFETAKGGPQFQAVIADIDPEDGRASAIIRLSLSDR